MVCLEKGRDVTAVNKEILSRTIANCKTVWWERSLMKMSNVRFALWHVKNYNFTCSFSGFTNFHKRRFHFNMGITYVHIQCASFTTGVESVVWWCILGLSIVNQIVYIRIKTVLSIILAAVEMNMKASIHNQKWNEKVHLSFSWAQFDRAPPNMFDVQTYTKRHVQKSAKCYLELSFLETHRSHIP